MALAKGLSHQPLLFAGVGCSGLGGHSYPDIAILLQGFQIELPLLKNQKQAAGDNTGHDDTSRNRAVKLTLEFDVAWQKVDLDRHKV
jgi:hypothetical protein